MKNIVGFLLLLLSTSAFSAGYTPWEKPTRIEYVHGGILVSGNFGDVNGCGKTNYIYIKSTPTDPDIFKTMMSIIITAITAQREVRFYIKECTSVRFHWGSGNVVNKAHTSGFFMR